MKSSDYCQIILISLKVIFFPDVKEREKKNPLCFLWLYSCLSPTVSIEIAVVCMEWLSKDTLFYPCSLPKWDFSMCARSARVCRFHKSFLRHRRLSSRHFHYGSSFWLVCGVLRWPEVVKPISLYRYIRLVCNGVCVWERTVRRIPHLEFVFEKSLSNFTFPGCHKPSGLYLRPIIGKRGLVFVALTFHTIGYNSLSN